MAAIFALAFGAIATILIAAHWQIRQVEPPLPTAQAIELALAEEDAAAAAVILQSYLDAQKVQNSPDYGRIDLPPKST